MPIPNATPSSPRLHLVADDEDHSGCRALLQVLDRIGDKWTVMVVGTLARGPMRFNAIQRAINGISHRMLTLTLRGLERDGMVERRAFATIPPKVEYELTPLGRSLIAPLDTLMGWAQENRPTIEQAQTGYDGRPQGD
ncbi:winged helix-turn-helix transcriptional regulator [Novosphingobium barchaimii]|nr:helix-turn-helix domain-containing protein [Novosphingobium barchaimii]